MILDTSKNSWHFINKGIESLNYNNLTKALSLFDIALLAEPENLVAQFHKGSTLYKLEKIKEAIEFFDVSRIIVRSYFILMFIVTS